VALLAVYLVWGSTYLAIRVALEGYPPFLFSAVRFLAAGAGMWLFLRVRGAPPPTRRQWLHGSLVGLLLPAIGVGSVVLAEQTVASGVTAVIVAGVALWTALFQGLFGQWPARRQWIGLVLGFSGVVVLCLGEDLGASPEGILLLLGSGIVWAFGSALSRYLDLPKGMMAPAVEMLAAGVFLGAASFVAGEALPDRLELRPSLAVAYLAVFGSVVAYSAYAYLLVAASPAVATSYCYVNPSVALALGTWLGGERFTAGTLAAVPVILTGVVLVLMNDSGRRKTGHGPEREPQDRLRSATDAKSQ
jgi:drug/metabolite transporter (DMT)-like permease